MDHINRVDGKVDHDIGLIPTQIVSEGEFSKLSQKVESKAQELAALIDELMEVEPRLACRPRNWTTKLPRISGTRRLRDFLVGAIY